jgi:hypothetical protein
LVGRSERVGRNCLLVEGKQREEEEGVVLTLLLPVHPVTIVPEREIQREGARGRRE